MGEEVDVTWLEWEKDSRTQKVLDQLKADKDAAFSAIASLNSSGDELTKDYNYQKGGLHALQEVIELMENMKIK